MDCTGSLLPATATVGIDGSSSSSSSMAASLTNPFELHSGGQGLEEMQHLLMCATLELESARAVASAEVEFHDGQVRHLQELLAAAQRERDEAREQFLGLQSSLSRSPSMNERGGSGRRTDGLSNWGLSGPPSVDHEQQQQQQLDMEELQMHLEILQDDQLDNLEDLHLDSALQAQQQHRQPESSSLQHHQQYNFHHEPGPHDCKSDQLLSHMQQEQLQCGQQVALLEEHQHALRFPQPQPSSIAIDTSLLQQSPWRQSFPGFSQPAVLCSAPPLLTSSLPTTLFQTQGSAVSSLLGILDRPYEGSGSTGLPIHQQQLSTLMPMHVLPEPPEADLQVMVSSLPEKGKLMQAVMDAGPLLQTLLMASSPQLPQWRHPPKGLDSRLQDFPSCVSFSSSTSCDSQTTASTGHHHHHIMGISQPNYAVVHRQQLHRLSSLSSHPIITPPVSRFSSVQRSLRRVNSMGHLMSPEMALNNQPRKYTKIY